MKKLVTCCSILAIAIPLLAHAADKPKAKAMDPKEMQEMMMKAAAPGPQHERFKKMEGEWNATVTSMMDPSQPPTTSQSSSTIKTLMGGRYCQEENTGDMMGMPFTGMGITGYDNILKKYVGTWIDNMGTGIMNSEGTADASGNVINWVYTGTDPMTGKVTKYRAVTRFTDDDHHSFEMYGKGPDGKEMKMMSIQYARK